MKTRFQINDSKLAYLIHGQYFRLDYQISRCLFVVFYYSTGRSFFRNIYFKRRSGIFENITNAYNPQIRIFAFGLGFKYVRMPLKINFLNARPQRMSLKIKPTTQVAQMNVLLNHTNYHIPKMDIQNIHSPELKYDYFEIQQTIESELPELKNQFKQHN